MLFAHVYRFPRGTGCTGVNGTDQLPVTRSPKFIRSFLSFSRKARFFRPDSIAEIECHDTLEWRSLFVFSIEIQFSTKLQIHAASFDRVVAA